MSNCVKIYQQDCLGFKESGSISNNFVLLKSFPGLDESNATGHSG